MPLSKETNQNLSELPFDVKHLENNEYPIDTEMKKYMDAEKIKEYQAAYDLSESDVIWRGIHIVWDSCDCGQGYGCSHPDWPFEGRFGDDPEAKFDFEDDSILLTKDGKHITIGPTDKMTMQDFKSACDIVGITLTQNK